MAKAIKMKHKLRFTTRTLINLEEIVGKKLPEILNESQDGSFTLIVQLFAAGANLTFDEAIDAIDDEIDNGLTFEDLVNEINKSVEDSNFFKNPALAKAVSENAKKEVSKV